MGFLLGHLKLHVVNKGIIRIVDFLSEKNELHVITKCLRDLDISPVDAFALVSLIDALPTKWRQFLKASNMITSRPNQHSTYNAKFVYILTEKISL